jgi:hypothetical protein
MSGADSVPFSDYKCGVQGCPEETHGVESKQAGKHWVHPPEGWGQMQFTRGSRDRNFILCPADADRLEALLAGRDSDTGSDRS